MAGQNCLSLFDLEPAVSGNLAILGREITPDLFKKTYAMFAPLALRPDPAICTVTRDIAYGPDKRNRLDVFRPNSVGNKPLTTLLFVHGGGFKHGDKGEADSPFYNNLGAWAAASGLLGVTMNYRLAPDFQWPTGAHDVASAINWLVNNVAAYRGDPGKIIVVGQSAGAVHVADYLTRMAPEATHPAIAGAVMISGIYDLTRFPRNPFEDAYYGTDAALMAERSTLFGLPASHVPCLFAVAELDSLGFQEQASLLISAFLDKTGQWPHMIYATGHNHLSTVYSLGVESNQLGAQIIEFCRRCEAMLPADRSVQKSGTLAPHR